MAKLPAPGEMVQIRPAPAHLPNVTCLARVLSATAESLLVERDNGTRPVVLSDNWVPAPTEPDPGPLARHMEARATDPTVKRTDDNLRQVFGPTASLRSGPSPTPGAWENTTNGKCPYPSGKATLAAVTGPPKAGHPVL